MRGAIPPLIQYAFMAWCSVKIKHRDNVMFIFTFFLVNSCHSFSSEARSLHCLSTSHVAYLSILVVGFKCRLEAEGNYVT